ncbi:MAG: hypothetical protein LQ342_004391 [Letrouitia transgressa]|nr:MAG: hypothetical protein LQ342_004391 [Letrouitia transgressa]
MDSPTSPDEYMPIFYVGQHESKRPLPVTDQVLRQAQDCNYDMLTSPITTPFFHSRVLALFSNHSTNLTNCSSTDPPNPTIPPLSPVDTPLPPTSAVNQIVGTVSPWIDLSSPDPLIYDISRQVLELEIAYAAFCGLSSVIVPGPKLRYGNAHGEGVAQYAHAIQDTLGIGNYTQILIKLSMMDHPDYEEDDMMGSLAPFARPEYIEQGGKQEVDLLGTWDAWHVIRTICKYNARLFVALSIPRHLPPPYVQSRWHSEPLRLLSLTSQTFLPNPQGYPVLTKDHRALIFRYMRIRNPPWILLCDVGPVPGLNDPDAIIPRADGFISPDAATDAADSPTPAEASLQQEAQQRPYENKARKDPTPHLSYIRNLQRKQPPQTILERFGAGYQDYLQGPLQPLSDNLESITYEVFEKDPVKYDLYERAIRLALTDWVAAGQPGSSPSGAIVVTVVGAGRGPLVTRALCAAEDAGVHIELWAVEKNPNAYVLLQRHNEVEWSNQVRLVQSDMRCWSGPCTPVPNAQPSNQQQQTKRYKVDILISELLGSFADNELSPECLDPLIHNLLNPTQGISIPNSYTSYLTPIAAPKLHTDILARAAAGDAQAHNTPYVVMLHAMDFLSLPSSTTNLNPIILPAWSFHNRRRPSTTPSLPDNEKGDESQSNNKHNTRAAHISFPLPHRGTMHGLAGYFQASLYGPVTLSTHPGTMEAQSAGMMSWFPIFFPLKEPLYCPTSSTLTVHMYRCTDGRKVWYEWMVESFLDDNRGARSGKMRLGCSGVGSSREGGCLM